MSRVPSPLAGLSLFVLAVAPLLAGCGGGSQADDGKTIARGRLLKGGAPYVLDQSKIKLPKGGTAMPPGVSGGSMLQVNFIAIDSKEQHTATTDPNFGSFEVTGPGGKGIKPGKYKITVSARVGFSPSDPDLFDNKFSAEKSQIVREVKAGEDIVIDLDKPQG